MADDKKTIYPDLKQFELRCVQSFEDYVPLGELRKGANGRHIFIDRGSNILAVAHLDTVQDSKAFNHITMDDGQWVLSKAVDDRAGAYILLDFLPLCGPVYDVLLTEGEEHGASTAKDFVTSKQYNWMFQFDRMGETVVSYQYRNADLDKLIREAGGNPSDGLWSDIGDLERLGCKGVNWGTAYYENHGPWARIHIGQMCRQINQFIKFYYANYETHLVHTEMRGKAGKYSGNTKYYPAATPPGGVIYPRNQKKEKEAWQTSIPGYRWCTECFWFIHEDFWQKGAEICEWCQGKKTAKRVICPTCHVFRVEGSFGKHNVCYACEAKLPKEQLLLPESTKTEQSYNEQLL